MEIDNTTTAGDETIVLFPQSYNKRGDERLHSVQGVTLDGREVNVKLRIDEAMLGKESTPSIAEFSREDVKAKNPCLATPDNAFNNREGVLLFTGCKVEGENRKGIPTYTARWAYVLASHSDDQDPVFGLGRIVIIADSQAVKAIHTELEDLERLKPVGWEAIAERKRKALSDPLKLSYFGHLYQDTEEQSFPIENRAELIEFADSIFTSYTRNGVVGGVLIRLKDENGALIPGFSTEVFPRWIRHNTYQSGADVMKFFFRAHDQRSTEKGAATFVAMPIKRYACGPSFKNYYFLKKPDDSLLKIRKHFLINNEPTVSRIALSLSSRGESGESFMLKYYPLTNPISSVATIGEEAAPADEVLSSPAIGLAQVADSSMRPKVGSSSLTALDFPAWYQPILISALPLRTPLEKIEVVVPDSSIAEIPPELVVVNTDSAAANGTGQPSVGSYEGPEVVTEIPLEEIVHPVVIPQEALEAPLSDFETKPVDHSQGAQEQQEGASEVLTGDEQQEHDLSSIFSDLSEQEIEEAEKAAAEILAAVALEPTPMEDPGLAEEAPATNTEPDSKSGVEFLQTDSPPPLVGPTPGESEETTLDEESPRKAEVERDDAVPEPQDGLIDDLRIIDTSTDGQDDPGADGGVLLAEYTSSVKALNSESGTAPAEPEKKSALALFLERQGLL